VQAEPVGVRKWCLRSPGRFVRPESSGL